MQANVKGTTMPVLEMVLEPGEALVSTHGDLSWMSPNMQMSQSTSTGGGGGLMAGLKRMAGGGGLFVTRYEAQGSG
ncbi:MAG: AIM24 family protein, partial [Acidimicrobiales bacterium]